MGRDTFLAGSGSAGTLIVSRASVLLDCRGDSSSLLTLCDATPWSTEPRCSVPDCEPDEARLDASGRTLPTAIENRPPPGLVPAVREVPDDTEGWRPTRAAGTAGGPIDDLVVPDAARDPLAVAAVPRAFEGVVVREGPVLEGFVPSCFVGDLVGD